MTSDCVLTEAVQNYLAGSPQLSIVPSEILEVEELTGDHNSLWRIKTAQRDIVLKMFLDAGQARGRRQFSNQNTAAQIGVAPQPITFDRYPHGLSHQVMLYEWCPGTPLDPRSDENTSELAVALAAAHARHPEEQARLSPHPVNQHYQWSLIQGSRRLVEEGVFRGGNSKLSDMVLEALARAEILVLPELDKHELTPPALVHGDLQLEHCLMVEGRIQLLDWEMGGLGDPAREISHIFLHMFPELTSEERTAWLKLYEDRAGFPDLSRRISVYDVLLPLASLFELILLPAMTHEPQAAAEECQLLQLAFGLCMDHVTFALDMDIGPVERQELSNSYLALRQNMYEQPEAKEVAP